MEETKVSTEMEQYQYTTLNVLNLLYLSHSI